VIDTADIVRDAIFHTFNGKLEFNSHVHTMVTGGGLHGSSNIWVSRVYYERDAVMEAWRKAVIALLRSALRAGQLRTELTADQMGDLLTHIEKRWWSIKIQSFEDKAAAYRAVSDHLDRATKGQVLVQRQEVASQGLRAVLTGRFHRPLGATHSGTPSPRCSELWAVCSACSPTHLGSDLRHSETRAKAMSQTSSLGRFHKARLRA
jgi:hypothetical protein